MTHDTFYISSRCRPAPESFDPFNLIQGRPEEIEGRQIQDTVRDFALSIQVIFELLPMTTFDVRYE